MQIQTKFVGLYDETPVIPSRMFLVIPAEIASFTADRLQPRSAFRYSE